MTGKQPKRKQRPGVDEYGRTPLHNLIVPFEGDIDLQEMKRLIDAGADPNAQDDNGWTPLHIAAQESSLDAVRLLLDAGANPNVRNSGGQTPLSPAFHFSCDIRIMDALLDAGADPFAKNKNGVSIAEVAFRATADDPRKADFIKRTAERFRQSGQGRR
jgi:ankyrin repeat protein